MQPDKLLALLDLNLLFVALLAFVLGVVGAVLHGGDPAEPTAPKRTTGQRVRDLLGGGVAAVAILYVTKPDSGIALVSGSLVAGYASKAVLAALQARAVAAVAKEEAKQAKLDAKEARAEVQEALGRQVEARSDLRVLVTGVSNLDAEAKDHTTSVTEMRRVAADLKRKHFAK